MTLVQIERLPTSHSYPAEAEISRFHDSEKKGEMIKKFRVFFLVFLTNYLLISPRLKTNSTDEAKQRKKENGERKKRKKLVTAFPLEFPACRC